MSELLRRAVNDLVALTASRMEKQAVIDPSVKTALLGALGGGIAGGAAGAIQAPEGTKSRRGLRGALAGAALGGGLGYAAPALGRVWGGSLPAETEKSLQDNAAYDRGPTAAIGKSLKDTVLGAADIGTDPPSETLAKSVAGRPLTWGLAGAGAYGGNVAQGRLQQGANLAKAIANANDKQLPNLPESVIGQVGLGGRRITAPAWQREAGRNWIRGIQMERGLASNNPHVSASYSLANRLGQNALRDEAGPITRTLGRGLGPAAGFLGGAALGSLGHRFIW